MNDQQFDAYLLSQIEKRTPWDAFEPVSKRFSAKQMVWWGCLCSWATWRPVPPRSEDVALGFASCWVLTGHDRYRLEAAEYLDAGYTGICCFLLQSVVNSGGSLVRSEAIGSQVTPDVAGPLVVGYLHHLLALQAPVPRAQEAQKFVHFARSVLAEPLPVASGSHDFSAMPAPGAPKSLPMNLPVVMPQAMV